MRSAFASAFASVWVAVLVGLAWPVRAHSPSRYTRTPAHSARQALAKVWPSAPQTGLYSSGQSQSGFSPGAETRLLRDDVSVLDDGANSVCSLLALMVMVSVGCTRDWSSGKAGPVVAGAKSFLATATVRS